jgi:hypothetical protein
MDPFGKGTGLLQSKAVIEEIHHTAAFTRGVRRLEFLHLSRVSKHRRKLTAVKPLTLKFSIARKPASFQPVADQCTMRTTRRFWTTTFSQQYTMNHYSFGDSDAKKAAKFALPSYTGYCGAWHTTLKKWVMA